MTLRTKLKGSIHAISGVERATSYQYLALRRSNCSNMLGKVKREEVIFLISYLCLSFLHFTH